MRHLYFDSAATTPLHPEVKKSMNEVQDVFANPYSKHISGVKAREIVEASLQKIADRLGVKKENLCPTYGGTDANRRVLWAMRKRFKCPDLWASLGEHSSIRDEILDTHLFDPFSFEGIGKNPSFLALMSAHNETGVIFDAKSLREKYPQALILQDQVQSTGKIPFDFSHCDFASFSAHKIYGPKTVGLLYIQNPDLFPTLSRDTHTVNVSLIAGMAKAFELLDEDLPRKLKTLTDRLEKSMEEINVNKKIIHKERERVPGIVSVAFENIRGSEIMMKLSTQEGISVSTGSACSSDLLSVTPSIQVFEKDPRYQYPVRIGLHRFLTEKDIDEFVEILKDMVENPL